MTPDVLAYGVKIAVARKDGSEVELWMADGTRHGAAFSLRHAMQFDTEREAREAAHRRGAALVRVLPIVAAEVVA
jgi:hypothetical protein